MKANLIGLGIMALIGWMFNDILEADENIIFIFIYAAVTVYFIFGIPRSIFR